MDWATVRAARPRREGAMYFMMVVVIVMYEAGIQKKNAEKDAKNTNSRDVRSFKSE